MRFLMLLVLLSGVTDGVVHDVHGRRLTPLQPPGLAGVLFFVMTDCPLSNAYAQEIQRLCDVYRDRQQVQCTLVYEDMALTADAARHHLAAYGYAGIPAVIDSERALATAAAVSVTPSAIVVDRQGQVRYRGRIDNLYVALGKTRWQVTEHYLRDAVDSVLANRPVAVSETPAIGCHIVPNRAPGRSGHAQHINE